MSRGLQVGASRLKLEPCDLSDVVGAALEELEASARMSHITIEIPEDLPLVQMDFNLIAQVLVNLFSNALKFSAADEPIELRGRIVGDKLEVAVADRGRGIPEEDLGRVFEKFHRLAESSSVNGLGLGLSICKEFVEAHGGRICLENNPGRWNYRKIRFAGAGVGGDWVSSNPASGIQGFWFGPSLRIRVTDLAIINSSLVGITRTLT